MYKKTIRATIGRYLRTGRLSLDDYSVGDLEGLRRIHFASKLPRSKVYDKMIVGQLSGGNWTISANWAIIVRRL